MPDRRRVGRWVLRTALVIGGLVAVYLVVTAVLVARASRLDERDRSDAVVVLGAAQYDGEPSPVLKERLDHALELYQEGVAPLIMLTGAKQPGDRFTEAYAGFRYLAVRGVPEEDLLIVSDGSSTWESLSAARRVLEREGADTITLVSDSYHNRRLQGIAGELGLDAYVSPTAGDPTWKQLARETGLVALGQIVGYGRMLRMVT